MKSKELNFIVSRNPVKRPKTGVPLTFTEHGGRKRIGFDKGKQG